MATTGGEIGNYLDPSLINNELFGGDIIINPSWGVGIMGTREVPLWDGRTVIIDSQGVIIDMK